MAAKFPEKRFDLGLVHTYGFEGGLHPNLRGTIVNNAAAELYRLGLIDTLIVAGGKIGGPKLPDVSVVSANDLHDRLGVPRNRIVVVPRIIRPNGQTVEVRSTRLEIEALIQIANTEGTANFTSVADSLHKRYVERQHLKMRTGAETYNASGILVSLAYPKSDYLPMLFELEYSRDQLIFGLQEDLINFVDSLPLTSRLLEFLAQQMTTKPNLGGN